jgi:VanZ family protein
LLIVYGSLYPWHFVARDLPANPLWILMHRWGFGLDRFTVRDAIVNVALYLPAGMAGYLAFRGPARIWGPIGGGFALSCAIEMLQLYIPGRTTSALDVVTNVIGLVAGLFAGMIFERIAAPPRGPDVPKRLVDRAALSLLFVWVGYLVFPLFPIIGTFTPKERWKVFAHASPFDTVNLISTTVSWFAGGVLLRAGRIRNARRWLAIALVAIPLQFVIIERQPLPSQLIGAVLGLLLFFWLGRKPFVLPVEAAAFLLALIIRGLAPFQWTEAERGFNWVPFGGFLNTPWQQGILILFEKGFYYGTAIWLLVAAGMRWWQSTVLVAAVLGLIEAIQMHLPGRTPEIADPVLAILLGFGLFNLSRGTEIRSRSAE